MKVLEVFAPLFGHWQGAEEQLESPWSPATTARAALSFRADVGGAAMLSDYRQVRANGAELYGHGVFLVDDALGVSCWWFDSSGRAPAPHSGGWTDGALVLTNVSDRGREQRQFALDGEELTYAIDVAIGQGGLEPLLRGRYRSVSMH